jgi:hypothetical protein
LFRAVFLWAQWGPKEEFDAKTSDQKILCYIYLTK